MVLYHEEGEIMALSFKLEFPCSNNITKYEAYLNGLATALEMGIKHLKVISNSNLVVCQAKGSFSLKEPSLAPYWTLAQNGRKVFYVQDRAHSEKRESVRRHAGHIRLVDSLRRK